MRTKFLLAAIIAMLLSACATPQGVIVSTLVPAEIDITTDSALEGDVLQNIVVDRIKGVNSDYVKYALKNALTNPPVFNIVSGGKAPNTPRIRVRINKFRVERDREKDGYVTRRGVAEVTFTLLSTGGHNVAPCIETDQIMNTQPVGSMLRSKEEILKKMGENVCRNFVGKITPTKKKEFRQFAKGNSQVKKGIGAAMQKNWDGALSIWKSVIQADPQNGPAHYNSGIAYEALGKLRRAFKSYQKAVEVDPANALYNKTYGKLKTKQKTHQEIKNIKEEIRDESVSGSD